MSDQIDMSRRPALALIGCFGVALFVLSSFAGCGSNDPVTLSNAAPVEGQTTETPAKVLEVARQRVAGVWLGEAFLDREKLDELLSSKTEEEKQALLQKASSFLSTVMAIEFGTNGQMINEVEITPHGMEAMVESSAGTWTVIDADGQRMIIETETQTPEGTMAKDQKVYKFYEDGDHFAVLVPLQDELEVCNPLIIFERQNLEATAVAELPSMNQTK